MTKSLLLGYDIGTTGAKAAIFKEDTTLVGRAYTQYDTYYPEPGWVEQAPEDWWDACVKSTRTLMAELEIDANDIAGISFTGQMMGQVPVDREGNLLQKHVPIWCDARASEQMERVFAVLGGYEAFYNITMQGHNPQMYALFRAMWYRDNMPDVYQKTHKYLHSKEFIAHRMTGNFATDYTDQALSCTLDMKKRTWSMEMFDAAGVQRDKWPELYESTDVMGHLSRDAAEMLSLLEGIPVVVGSGDGPSAAAGAAALEPGDAYFYIGSASWGGTIETEPIGDFETRVIVHNHLVPGLYHPQYVMYTGGIAQQWAIETFFGREMSEAQDVYRMASQLSEQVPTSENTVVFLPYMRPGGAPHNNLNARGVFVGIGLNHKREHLFRAVIEGVCFTIKLMLDRFEKFRSKALPSMNVIGGGSRSPFWMQRMADITGRRITTTSHKQEANCLGAVQCAGVGVGLFKDFQEVKRLIRVEEEYLPDVDLADFYVRKYEVFLEAYQAMGKSYDMLADLERFSAT